MRHHSMLGLAALGIYFCISGALLAGTYSGGDGTAGNPYQIANKADLLELGATPEDYGKCFILTSDIDLAGDMFSTAIIAPDISNYTSGFEGVAFSGIFNGNNHIISNLAINTQVNDHIALFGRVDFGGQIKNLGVENVNLEGTCNIAGLVGDNRGTIIACYVTGSVRGEHYYAGGLVGNNDGAVTTCYTTCIVSGDDIVGGLVGMNTRNGTIKASYASGSVSGISHGVGGLIGKNYGIITSCFWDLQSSGQVGSSGGKGLTTEQMKNISYFQNAGWTDKGWVIQDGTDYPRLRWENTGGVPIPSSVIPFSGNGTANEPYRISTPEEFALLSWYSDILDKHIKLTVDLDLSDYTLFPIGDLGPFTGVFDGNDHTITNVVINQPHSNHVGLFGYVGSGGQVKNLNVREVTIVGYSYVGALLGYNFTGTIDTCCTTGSVSGFDYAIGGLAGYNKSGNIVESFSTCEVIGENIIGGLIGYNDLGYIISSSSDSSVAGSAGSYGIGGLVGYNYSGAIISSSAMGSVCGYEGVGGLVGLNEDGIITSCYAADSVIGTSGSWAVGGFVGANVNGSIISSYAVGCVTGSSGVGGLIGCNTSGSIAYSFWDIQTSGQENSDGGVGKTTAEMQMVSTFTDAGWDFVGESANGLNDYWQMNADVYPNLVTPSWTLTGKGTSLDPYIINSREDLGKVWSRPWAYYRLVRNLDLKGISWSTSPIPMFRGFFEGQGCIISHLMINRICSDYAGLFGCISGTIKNLGAKDVNIIGCDYVGGLIGCIGGIGTITDCFASGVVTGNDYVGGVVGGNSDGMIINCYATGQVGGYGCIGGLVGWNYGAIVNCYAAGLVWGAYNSGLCGYQSGVAPKIENSFWNMQTSGTSRGVGIGPVVGVTGKTTAEMQMVSTFTDAGWDFAGEAANGTVDVWRMCGDGVGYPQLSWESGRRGDFACPDGVGVEDLEALGMVWLTAEGQAGYSGACDANGDGRIDMADFEVLAGEWMGD